MCKKPVTKVDHSTTSTQSVVTSTEKVPDVFIPTHSEIRRNTDYDWVYFLVPALFCKITPVVPLYMIAICRIIAVKVILSLHYMFVDKDNYLNKLPRKQLEREKQEYLTAITLHMWTQIPLQLIFPSLFFSNNDHANVIRCVLEVLACHVFIVEPLYYVVHRWLHLPTNMKSMHGFHHLSISTLPTTSSVQNFYEHIIYVMTFGPAFLLPYLIQQRQHYLAIGLYLITFDIVNAWGHTNVRVRHPIFTSKYSPFTYLFYTPEFHLGHHAYFNANYALFMPIWDHLFGSYREYTKRDVPLLPPKKQDFVFIGHNGGLGHYFTTPEFSFYNVYNDYPRTVLPIKMEFYISHLIALLYRLFARFYYCSRFCVANEYIARIICLARTPYDYMTPKNYSGVNREILQLIRQEYTTKGTRYFGLGNLNKMQQLNNSGIDIVQMIQEDSFLRDKNIRIWTGDTMTVASVYHQIADIPNLKSFYYIGAGGKVGRAVCDLLVQTKPHLKIRIFSKNEVFDHPNITYSKDLSEMTEYKVVLVGKILSGEWYKKALKTKNEILTRYVLDYTVPALPIVALQKRPENIQHVRVGLLKTVPNNPFLKGHYDLCMSHDENHIVPCHFGCLLNTIDHRETNEVGDIDLDTVEKMWEMTLARGFRNIDIDYN
jgi:sterol desaturase/sphingolipid hydroxylase (fatty acid hydroxylase superfamily)